MWNFYNGPPDPKTTYGLGAYAVLAVFVVLAYAAGRCPCLRRRAPQNGLYCKICGVWLNGTEHMEQHKQLGAPLAQPAALLGAWLQLSYSSPPTPSGAVLHSCDSGGDERKDGECKDNWVRFLNGSLDATLRSRQLPSMRFPSFV